MIKNKLPTYDDDRIKIILAEYHELRIELMYFISEQRKSISLMSSIVAGQTIFLLNNQKLNYEAIAYVYLFVIPLIIFILMIRSLESTSKILLIADYLHKGIKEQLKQFFCSGDNFFEWEEHKGKTNRVSRTILKVLDYSRWWIFGIGILSSFLLGIYFSYEGNTLNFKVLIPSGILNLIWICLSISVNKSFNEIDGEAKKEYIK